MSGVLHKEELPSGLVGTARQIDDRNPPCPDRSHRVGGGDCSSPSATPNRAGAFSAHGAGIIGLLSIPNYLSFADGPRPKLRDPSRPLLDVGRIQLVTPGEGMGVRALGSATPNAAVSLPKQGRQDIGPILK